MHIEDLLTLQKKFNGRFKNQKSLEKQDIINKLILALFVEVGEFANEVGSFKYWKQNHNIVEEKLYTEFADIILIWLSLADEMDLDISKLVNIILNKVCINNERQEANY